MMAASPFPPGRVLLGAGVPTLSAAWLLGLGQGHGKRFHIVGLSLPQAHHEMQQEFQYIKVTCAVAPPQPHADINPRRPMLVI